MPAVIRPTHGPLPTERTSYGCFETMRAYRGRIFRLDQHLDRLCASARSLGVGVIRDRRRLRTQLIRALASSGLQEATVRIALMPHRPPGAREPLEPSIIVLPAQPPSPAAFRKGIPLAVVPTRTSPVGAVDAQAKYSARLSSIMATQEAHLRGVDEALFLHTSGVVTESTASNFSIIKGGTLFTPPCWLGLLRGVTREVVGELARAQRIPVREVPLTRHDVYIADEAFLSSTTKELLPVTRVDGRVIGTGFQGPLTKRLHRAFRALVARELGHGAD